LQPVTHDMADVVGMFMKEVCIATTASINCEIFRGNSA